METTHCRRFVQSCLVIFSLAAITTRAAEKILAKNGDIEIEPINHATFVLRWNGKTIFVDPVGGAQKFTGKPDLILVTDIHGDHLNADTLKGVAGDKTKIVAPAAVGDKLPAELKSKTE